MLAWVKYVEFLCAVMTHRISTWHAGTAKSVFSVTTVGIITVRTEAWLAHRQHDSQACCLSLSAAAFESTRGHECNFTLAGTRGLGLCAFLVARSLDDARLGRERTWTMSTNWLYSILLVSLNVATLTVKSERSRDPSC
jgi:hypothetical protein